MDTKEKMLEKVRKLLAYAEDRQNHEDAQAYYDRAFELMARYGVSEHDVRAQDNAGVEVTEVTFGGSYTDMQNLLLECIGWPLNCVVMSWGVANSVRRTKATVFGKPQHLERVLLLYSILCPTMLARAYDDALISGWSGKSVTVQRRSYMRGFALTIRERLTETESRVVQEAGGEHALARVGDLESAREAFEKYKEEHGLITENRNNKYQHDPMAMSRGMDSAQSADIGHKRMKNRSALGPGAVGK